METNPIYSDKEDKKVGLAWENGEIDGDDGDDSISQELAARKKAEEEVRIAFETGEISED